MRQIQGLINDVERPCATRECEGIIRVGQMAVREFRTFGKDRYHHKTCWERTKGRAEKSIAHSDYKNAR